MLPEPEFVNFFKSPGIDSQPGGIYFLESNSGLLKRFQIQALSMTETQLCIEQLAKLSKYRLHISLRMAKVIDT